MRDVSRPVAPGKTGAAMPVEERRPVDSPVREKPRPAPPASMPSNGNGSAAADIRRRVPYAFAPANLAALGLRGVRVASLLAVDIAGITGGVYAALVLREVWMGRTPPWGGLWSTAADWFGFLWLVTALVFAQAGLYAARQRRPGTARIVSSVVLVGALTLAFALGTGFDFRTYAIVPTSIVDRSCADRRPPVGPRPRRGGAAGAGPSPPRGDRRHRRGARAPAAGAHGKREPAAAGRSWRPWIPPPRPPGRTASAISAPSSRASGWTS